MNKQTSGKKAKSAKRNRYTSPVTQARVREKYAKGYTKTEIGRQENLYRGTVAHILNDAEADECLLQAKRNVKQLAESSTAVLTKALQSKGGDQLALRILSRLGLLGESEGEKIAKIEAGRFIPEGLPQTINLNNLTLSPQSLQLLKHFEDNEERFSVPDERRAQFELVGK